MICTFYLEGHPVFETLNKPSTEEKKLIDDILQSAWSRISTDREGVLRDVNEWMSICEEKGYEAEYYRCLLICCKYDILDDATLLTKSRLDNALQILTEETDLEGRIRALRIYSTYYAKTGEIGRAHV